MQRRSRRDFTWSRAAVVCAAVVLGLSLFVGPSQLPGATTTCTMRLLTGWPCPVCGMTRATCAIGHGDFALAAQLNPLSFAVYAALLTVVLSPIWRRLAPGIAHLVDQLLLSRVAVAAYAAVFVSVWIVRLAQGWRGVVQ